MEIPHGRSGQIMIHKEFWKDKKVFLTGHTGFKGTWLSLWLTELGAKVTGYALAPPTNPNLFDLAKIEELVDSRIGDINDAQKLKNSLLESDAQIVFHMAAQPIVGDSYKDPVGTFQTNVMGTLNVLEAVREAVEKGSPIRAVVNITTDKCYENQEWHWGYRENEPLGGSDPYSASKACSEIVTSAMRKSFFENNPNTNVGIATARAGNVIGGGDWSPERLIPQCIDALLHKKPLSLRKPKAVRPWQHVLEPLAGYLVLAEKLYEDRDKFSQAWNFGPNYQDCREVGFVVERLVELWGEKINVEVSSDKPYAESNLLKLDYSKAKALLGWQPVWNLEQSLQHIIDWTLSYKNQENIREVTKRQINEYMAGFNKRKGPNG